MHNYILCVLKQSITRTASPHIHRQCRSHRPPIWTQALWWACVIRGTFLWPPGTRYGWSRGRPQASSLAKLPSRIHTPAAPQKQTALKQPLSLHYTLPFLTLCSGGLETKHHINEENRKHVAFIAEVCVPRTKYALVIAVATIMVNFGCNFASQWAMQVLVEEKQPVATSGQTSKSLWLWIKSFEKLMQCFHMQNQLPSNTESPLSHHSCYSLQISINR